VGGEVGSVGLLVVDRAGWERAEANKQVRARGRSYKSIKPRR